jgi:hypothetical protein
LTTPFPGWITPQPRTWSQGDFITTPRLRGDMTNFGAMIAGQARPILVASMANTFALTSGVVTLLPFNSTIISLNTWNVQIINATRTNPYYQIPLPGWYLLQGNVSYSTAGSPASFKFAMGFDEVINGASAVNIDGGGAPASTTAAENGSAGCDLVQFNSFANSGDTLAVYGFTNNTTTTHVAIATLMSEWVALPSPGATLTKYTGPYGTKVSSPAGILPFPAGPGTTQTAGIVPGATSISVADPTGIIVGGTLGLGYINGNLVPPGTTGSGVAPEPVTVTSVSGATIGISATVYGHASGDPVAVPVSAALLNQQCRDAINFMTYPPILRAVATQAQSIPSSGFPGTTQITSLSATVDNFGGLSASTYTVPISGVYLVYGQVYYAGSSTGFVAGAGLKFAGGTTQWGTIWAFNGGTAQSLAATVRRQIRLVAGQTIQLIAYQALGSAMNTEFSAPNQTCRLIVVFRAF